METNKNKSKAQKRRPTSDSERVVEYPDLTNLKKLIMPNKPVAGPSRSKDNPKTSNRAVITQYQPPGAATESEPEAESSRSAMQRAPKTTIDLLSDSDSEASARPPPDPRLLSEQRQAINDFQQMLAEDPTHYRILGLPDFADETQLAKAERKQLAKFHPDKNGFPEARKYFRKIRESSDLLRDRNQKARYDKSLREEAESRQRRAIGKRRELQFGEDFHHSAWGREPGDNVDLSRNRDETESESDLETVFSTATVDDIPPPSKAVVNILKQISTEVTVLVTSRDQAAREDASLHIKRANAEIKQANKASGAEGSNYTIKESAIAPLSHNFMRMKQELRREKGVGVRVAQGLSDSIIFNFDRLRKSPENQWPAEWVNSLTKAIANAYNKKGYSFSDPRLTGAKLRDVSRFRASDRRKSISHHSEHTHHAQRAHRAQRAQRAHQSDQSDAAMEDAPSLAAPIAFPRIPTEQIGTSDGALSTLHPKPGYTLDGERILGYRGWFSSDIRDGAHVDQTFNLDKSCLTKIQFIVEDLDRETIKLLPGHRAGNLVKNAYFQQPLRDQRFIPNRMVEAQGTIPIPTRILAYACYDTASLNTVADGVALCEDQSRSHFLVSLTVLRNMLGKERVDATVRQFLKARRRPPPLVQGKDRRQLGYRTQHPRGVEGIDYRQGSDDNLTDDTSLSSDYDVPSSDYEAMRRSVRQQPTGRLAGTKVERSDGQDTRGLVADFGRRLRI